VTRHPPEFERIRATLSRVIARVCPGWLAHAREDIVQDACLRIAKAWSDSEESGDFGTSYLWKVGHSAVMDEIRRRRRRQEASLSDPSEQPDSAAVSPARRGASAELRREIHDGLRLLQEPRRWAVLLYLYGFSLRDSATTLGWTTKRVDNQRYRGLAELRDYLESRGFKP